MLKKKKTVPTTKFFDRQVRSNILTQMRSVGAICLQSWFAIPYVTYSIISGVLIYDYPLPPPPQKETAIMIQRFSRRKQQLRFKGSPEGNSNYDSKVLQKETAIMIQRFSRRIQQLRFKGSPEGNSNYDSKVLQKETAITIQRFSRRKQQLQFKGSQSHVRAIST